MSREAQPNPLMRTPDEVRAAVEEAGCAKAAVPAGRLFIRAVLAGAFVAFGGSFMLVVRADGSLSFTASALLGGLVFCLGLFLVLVAGAELFTGNALMLMGALSRRFSLSRVLRNWVVAYAGNAVGALIVAGLLMLADTGGLADGAVGAAALSVAAAKAALAPGVAFVRGILCNVLVCLAVWMGFAGKTVCDKLAATVLPVCAFVALGFEHSVANLFFLPFGLMLQAATGTAVVSVAGAAMNIVCVTAGNIVGGAIVAAAYWVAFGPRRVR